MLIMVQCLSPQGRALVSRQSRAEKCYVWHRARFLSAGPANQRQPASPASSPCRQAGGTCPPVRKSVCPPMSHLGDEGSPHDRACPPPPSGPEDCHHPATNMLFIVQRPGRSWVIRRKQSADRSDIDAWLLTSIRSPSPGTRGRSQSQGQGPKTQAVDLPSPEPPLALLSLVR